MQIGGREPFERDAGTREGASHPAHTESELLAILQPLAQPLVVFNADGSVRLMNDAARALHDLQPDARLLSQHDFLDTFEAFDAAGRPVPHDDRVTLRVLRGETLTNVELTVRNRRTGRSWQGLYTATPIYNATGDVQYAVVAIQDISERRAAEAALQRAHDTFRHLVDNSPFGIYVVDTDFRLQMVSAGAQKVFANVRPLLGRDFAEVLRILWEEPFASQAIARFRHTLETGVPYRSPSTVERRSDIGATESYDWQIERLTLPDGRPGVVCHFYDLSERQRYEAELRDADRRKNEFLAMLAHELRNPLAPIRTSIGMMQARGLSDPALERCSGIIDRQLGHMARLLDDLLDVSRLARGKLTLQRAPISLADAIRSAVEVCLPAIEQRKQTLVVHGIDLPVTVDADTARLTQVFGNLLDNASKYSEVRSRLEISVHREDDEAVVSVRDDGIGIAPEMLDKVFELFTQSDGANDRSQGGLGIGLSLARTLVEMHGGSIRVESRGPGHGATFIVRLPTLPAPASTLPPAPQPAMPELSRLRVLVVDDNADAADSIALLLGQFGCDVRVSYRGEIALEEAGRFEPDLVLLDIGLPGMSGLEVCRRIRALPSRNRAFMVALTGWGQEDDRRRSESAGFDLHLVKPVNPQTLIEMASSLVRQGDPALRSE